MTFEELERSLERIAASVLAFLKENNVPDDNTRGQGYDSASNMSSCKGMKRQEVPLATYMHRSGHCLNLAITCTNSCALPQVHKVLECFRNFYRYIFNSPKIGEVFEMIVRYNVTDPEKRKLIMDLCKAQWADWHWAYQHFYQAYTFIV